MKLCLPQIVSCCRGGYWSEQADIKNRRLTVFFLLLSLINWWKVLFPLWQRSVRNVAPIHWQHITARTMTPGLLPSSMCYQNESCQRCCLGEGEFLSSSHNISYCRHMNGKLHLNTMQLENYDLWHEKAKMSTGSFFLSSVWMKRLFP